MPHATSPATRQRSATSQESLFDVDGALQELDAKSIEAIERATAHTWGGRACAAFRRAAQAKTGDDRRRWFMDGENYRQEAIEHAAMTGDLGFTKQVFDACEEERKNALGAVRAA